MFNIGTPEVIIILAVALLVFGPKKLPEIGKSLGQGLRELRKVSRDVMSSVEVGDQLENREETRNHVLSDSNRDS